MLSRIVLFLDWYGNEPIYNEHYFNLTAIFFIILVVVFCFFITNFDKYKKLLKKDVEKAKKLRTKVIVLALLTAVCAGITWYCMRNVPVEHTGSLEYNER